MTAPVTEPTATRPVRDFVAHLPGGRVVRLKATGFLDACARLAPAVADFIHPASTSCPVEVTR